MRRHTMLLLSLPFLALTSEARAGGYTGGPVTGGGSISGKVTVTGKHAQPAAMPVTKDHATCGHSKASEALQVGAGGALRNAVVYLDKIASGKPVAAKDVTLDQMGCTYVPHVQATTRGSQIELHSNDAVLHNVHGALEGKDILFNVAMPMKGQRIKKKLKKAGLVQVTCDAGHTWMKAYVQVFDHPYFAVTGADGSFQLGDVPPGTYDLVVWHELLGKQTQRVTVTGGGDAKVTFAFP